MPSLGLWVDHIKTYVCFLHCNINSCLVSRALLNFFLSVLDRSKGVDVIEESTEWSQTPPLPQLVKNVPSATSIMSPTHWMPEIAMSRSWSSPSACFSSYLARANSTLEKPSWRLDGLGFEVGGQCWRSFDCDKTGVFSNTQACSCFLKRFSRWKFI